MTGCAAYNLISVTTQQQNGMIKFKYNSGGGWNSAKSGPIKCDKGFKVRFDLQNT